MTKKLESFVSLQSSLEEIEQNNLLLSRSDYLLNLKAQCEFRQNALSTAEALIEVYKKENEDLKAQNNLLVQRLNEFTFLEADKGYSGRVRQLESTLLNSTQRINELLEKNTKQKERVRALESQILKMRNQQQIAKQAMKRKLSIQKQQQKQRNQVQSRFKNYLCLGKKGSILQSPREEREASQLRIMEWKLKQKDQEIIILLKRLRDVQQRNMELERKGRSTTVDSVENYSTRKNKVSEFYH